MALDVENPLNLRPSRADGSVHVPAWGLVTDAELCLVRLDAAGQVEHVAQCGGTLGADSRPGEGARFRILLRPHEPAETTPESTPEESDDATNPDRG